MKYLTFLPIAVLIILFVHIGRVKMADPAGAAAAAALSSPACESLRKELSAARAKLATDSTNVRMKGRVSALGALTKDVCGLDG
jgi:hypothetical protein